MSQTYFKVIFKIVGKDPQLAFVIHDHPDYEFMFKANSRETRSELTTVWKVWKRETGSVALVMTDFSEFWVAASNFETTSDGFWVVADGFIDGCGWFSVVFYLSCYL